MRHFVRNRSRRSLENGHKIGKAKSSEKQMTEPLENLYRQALEEAEIYLAEHPQVDVQHLIRIFLSSLLDCGYGIAPLEATNEMLEENDDSVIDYHRAIYRKMMARRPRLSL